VLARLEIDLGAIRKNAQTLVRLVGPAQLMAVVKANAYGHGLAAVGRALRGVAARFGVYALEEALELREAGIREPILIMGPVAPGSLEQAHAAGAAVTLWERGMYPGDVANAAGRSGSRFPVHVKINTGVARLGLDPNEAPDAIREYLGTPELQVEGIYSHLAAAEELDSSFTERQLATFEQVLDAAQYDLADLEPAPLRHIAASAAAMLWPQTRLDLVRAGIALYGLWPSPQTRSLMNGHGIDLLPALRWSTQLVAIREVEAGTSIGYGRTFVAPSPMTLGILPVGYAEGVPRAASNRAAVLVGGGRCAVVGRVCMNMTIVDLTGVRQPYPGMPATLIGPDGGDAITADDWAAWSDTINYEIVARLPAEIPRRFIDGDESGS
jgi:alanine racemase